MDRKTKLRIAVMPFALAGIIAPALGACSDNPLNAACCTDFKVGADLSATDFEGGVAFNGFIRASADFAAAATGMVTDTANACKAIATDLGADPNKVASTAPADQATGWCNEAVAQLQAKGVAMGALTISYQPPVCTVNVQAQAKCEGSCNVDASCQLTPAQVKARCTGGKLSGKCDAMCSGSCEGSANLAVTCNAKCSGTCDGTCDAGCSTGAPAGSTCGGSCTGNCTGKCRGSCDVSAGGGASCEGQCTGSCSVDFKAPSCTADLDPPSADCKADAKCQGSCNASASAKAECKEPSIEITGAAGVDASVIGTLKLNLPKLLLVFKARGELLVKDAQAVVQLGADATGSADLSVKAVACGAAAVTAIGDAAANAQASVSASTSVFGVVGVQ